MGFYMGFYGMFWGSPSGKDILTKNNYGKSPCLMGKSTISLAGKLGGSFHSGMITDIVHQKQWIHSNGM